MSRKVKNSAKGRSSTRRALLPALLASAALLVAAAPAQAAFGINSFGGSTTGADGGTLLQAGAHPNLTTELVFPVHPTSEGGGPDGQFKNVEVELPPGLVANPLATPRCTEAELTGSGTGQGFPECKPETQVGFVYLTKNVGAGDYGGAGAGAPPKAVWNIVPPAGVPARLGFNEGGVVVTIDAEVRSGSDYGVTAVARNSSQALPIRGAKVVLWDVPAASSHDSERTGFDYLQAPSSAPRRPFLSNPTSCPGHTLTTTARADSWAEPDLFHTASFDHDLNGVPIETTGCDRLRLNASITAQPRSTQADSPTGVDFSLTIPQSNDPYGLAPPHLRSATVTFPEGMSVNPASVDGLSACTPAQIGLHSEGDAHCPESSKLGEVQVETPVLEKPLEGAVYLAQQGTNPFNSLIAMYVVVKGPGVVIKLAGKVSPDPQTGQLTATFVDNPQLPFETLDIGLKGGPRAPLINPPTCGTKTTTARLIPWSALDPQNPAPNEVVNTSDSFQITSGPNGTPCGDLGRFKPGFEAGTISPVAGAYSPLVVNASRPDGSQAFKGVDIDLPQGLVGKLAGIPYCSEASLDAAAARAGRSELASPSCPVASKVGTVTVGAGAGPSPYNVDGSIYLTGPYKGAPLSLAVVTPAVAGPFDLGTVVVRNALQVDPTTAQIHAVSDPIPTILQGIPLHIRSVSIDTDRPEFTLNPTGCDPMSVGGTLVGTSSSAAVSNPFQVTNCAALAFKPKLSLSLSGAPTRRGGFPALKAVLTAGKGEANIKKAQVTLPKTEILEQAHIKTICTRVQYAAKACPARSIYGYAKAWTPLLDQPLQGPVYLRSSSHELPDLVASLDGQIHIDLAGRIDSVNARIRNTFEMVPDAPVSKFVLTMQGGKKGLLVNNTELCKAKPVAAVKFDGHNGKAHNPNPVVKVAGCGKKRKGK